MKTFCSSFLIPLAATCVVIFSSCSVARKTSSFVRTISNPIVKRLTVSKTKTIPLYVSTKATLTGPPEYIRDTVTTPVFAYKSGTDKLLARNGAPKKTVPPKIVEKGGRYVFIPPAYTMAKAEAGTEKYSAETLQQKIKKLKKFAKVNHYDTTVAFFVDMEVKSGKDRFLVVNLSDGTVIKKGLVAHGKGNERFTFDRKFSNGDGSNCTSLGIYKIGKPYNGAFGLSYKLYGLDKTNYNALRRYVVLHSMGSIPDTETKYPITQSEGCPAVAPSFLEQLVPVIEKAKKNVLMYIYYGEADNHP